MLSVAQATHVRASLCTPLQRGLAATEVFVCDAWLMLRWLYAGLYDGLQKFFFASSFRIIYHGQHPFYIWSPSVPSPETTRQPDLLLSGIVRLLWLGFEFFLVYMLVTGVVGARVASDTTGAGSQGSLTPETTGGSHTSRLGKRAFHRAQQRAQVAGGTFYKGKWCTAQSLNATTSFATTSRAPLRPGAFRGWKPRQDAMPLNIITWKSSGLSEAVLPEFLLRVDTLPADSRSNILLIQESHWRFTSEYKHGDWLAFHNGISEISTDRYAGLLTLVHIPGIHSEHVRVQNVLQGRLTHIHIDFPYRDVDAVHVYQHAASSDPAKTVQEKRCRLFNRLDVLMLSYSLCLSATSWWLAVTSIFPYLWPPPGLVPLSQSLTPSNLSTRAKEILFYIFWKDTLRRRSIPFTADHASLTSTVTVVLRLIISWFDGKMPLAVPNVLDLYRIPL